LRRAEQRIAYIVQSKHLYFSIFRFDYDAVAGLSLSFDSLIEGLWLKDETDDMFSSDEKNSIMVFNASGELGIAL
jgi:hypothetical protein